MWKDFNTKFEGILKSLRRHKELVESRASLTQYHIYRDDMTDIKAKVEELVDEERKKKNTSVNEWLNEGPRQKSDHDTYRSDRGKYSGTGDWIAENEAIKHWLDADVPSTPLLWMTGIPGAGEFIILLSSFPYYLYLPVFYEAYYIGNSTVWVEDRAGSTAA
jgi:hypothetical protein